MDLTPMAILLVLIVSIGSTALAFTIYLVLINVESPVVAGAVQFAIPIVVIIIGFFAFDERIGSIEWMGTAVIMSGLWLTMRGEETGHEDEGTTEAMPPGT